MAKAFLVFRVKERIAADIAVWVFWTRTVIKIVMKGQIESADGLKTRVPKIPLPHIISTFQTYQVREGDPT